MKKFVISTGNSIIGFIAWLILVSLISISIIMMFSSFWIGFGVLILGFIIYIFSFYFLYMVISIEESLKNIEINTKKEETQAEETNNCYVWVVVFLSIVLIFVTCLIGYIVTNPNY